MSYDLLLRRAIGFHNQGKLSEAEQIYRKILETAPKQPDILNYLGLIAQSKGLHAEAVDLFYKAAKNAPQRADIFFSLGISLNCWNKLHEAADAFHKALSLNPDLKEAWFQLGNIFTDLGQIEKSRQYYQKALELAPDYTEAQTRLCMTYISEAPEKTVSGLHEIIKRYPEEPLAFFLLSRILGEQNELAQAIEKAEAAYKIHPDNDEITALLGWLYLKTGNEKKSEDLLTRALGNNPRNVSALVNLANIKTTQKDFATAEIYYRRSLELEPGNFDAHFNYAVMLQNQDRTAEALERYRQAVILNPASAETSNNLGLILRGLGDYTEALGLFFNAFNLNPELEQTAINIAETLIHYSRSGKHEEALKIVDNWLHQYPNNIFAQHLSSVLKGEEFENNKIYNQKLFDHFADTYELVLKNIGSVVARSIGDLAGNVKGTIVDLGCGTGLVGEIIKNQQNQIIGIDISSRMLGQAQKKHIYNQLINSDIISWLKTDLPADTSLIIASDVFCYFGNLDELIGLCQNKPLIFSVEKSEDEKKDFLITETGRYKHSFSYINKLLTNHGYNSIKEFPLTLRYENGEGVKGAIFVAG